MSKHKNFVISQKALIYNEALRSFLVIKEKEKKEWDMPGGRINEGEELRKSFLREVKEKVGEDVKLEVKDTLSFGVVEHEPEKEIMLIFYFVKYVDGEIKPVEGIEYQWKKPDEILNSKEYSFWFKEAVKKALAYLEKEKALDSWKRCQADFENYKKDQAKYQEEFRKYAKREIIEQILPVLDNFEASLAHVPEDQKNSAWVAGIMHIKRQIEDVLKNNNVEEIAVGEGDKFDPEIHEAVTGEGERVKKVLQKGYKLNGRIIRAARIEVE